MPFTPKTADRVARQLWEAFWGARNVAPIERDTLYWNTEFWNELDFHGEKEMNPPVYDYAYKRAIGWQTTGEDVPPFGPYAQPPSDLRPVPPYPGDVVASPENSTPGAPPQEVQSSLDLLRVFAQLQEQYAALQATADMNLLAIKGLTARIEQIRTEVIRNVAAAAPSFLGGLFGRR